MPVNETYRQQVQLLMRLLPLVAEETCFGLKGGTAINLFIRDLPRLSVDIDLMYLPMQDRKDALAGIDAAMKRIETAIQRDLPSSRITHTEKEGAVLRLLISANATQVKIEVSPVLRGVVYEPRILPVADAVEGQFGFAETTVVSFADVYAGKLVAALDRQHPRDLFDVRDLFRNEGITDDIREAFVVYMLSHNRPMGEVLSGRCKNLLDEYRNGFDGMSDEDIPIEALIETQSEMIDKLIGGMPDRHREFLVSFEQGETNWPLLQIDHAKDLPAVRWRLLQLATRTVEQRKELVSRLEESLQRRVS